MADLIMIPELSKTRFLGLTEPLVRLPSGSMILGRAGLILDKAPPKIGAFNPKTGTMGALRLSTWKMGTGWAPERRVSEATAKAVLSNILGTV